MIKKSVVYLVLACLFFLNSCIPFENGIDENTKCTPPKNFTGHGLVGTWESGSSNRKDTLIINGDGTYKQIIYVENPSFNYESASLNWYIEQSVNEVQYLHLQGMRLCVYWSGVSCGTVGGGDQDWYDFCKEEWVETPDEGVMIIMGPPRGFEHIEDQIRLFALQKGTETTNIYHLITNESYQETLKFIKKIEN